MKGPKARVQELWPEAASEPYNIGGKAHIRVTVTQGRYAYGKTASAAWREAWLMILYSRELREGAAGGSAASPAPGDDHAA